MSTLPPAVRMLLVHAIECGGAWLHEDPVRVSLATLESAERRGLVRLERHNQCIVCATITSRGRAEMQWSEPRDAVIRLTAPGEKGGDSDG